MNTKKAKRIRKLVEHLQQNGTIANQVWESYVTNFRGMRVLEKGCGKHVYRMMKRKEVMLGRARSSL